MDTPPFNNLSDWLAWQETLHPHEIELGLARVNEVAERLELLAPEPCVITVAGTNGKGSSIAMLSNALILSGLNVGAYTSPHLLKYNERICINGTPVDDEMLCDAFEAVNKARGDTSLTYFEFGTLAALYVFANHQLDVIFLEVGLGGRLDAVNIIDADVALITNIGLDHVDWLGDDRSAIAEEKAGILRPDQRAIYNDPDPVDSVRVAAETNGTTLYELDRDYRFETGSSDWRWSSDKTSLSELPLHAAPDYQVLNAAGALKVLEEVQERLGFNLADSAHKLLSSLPDGRGQFIRVDSPGGFGFETIVDVAHNCEAIDGLVKQLNNHPCKGKTYALFGVMKDKPIEDMVNTMRRIVDEWAVTGLPVPRACSENDLRKTLNILGLPCNSYPSVESAWQALLSKITAEDRVVVFGSFFTVEAIFKILVGSSRDV